MNDLNQTIHGYLRMFFRRKWLFLIPAFAGLILSICASVVWPRSYKSSTTIFVEEGKTDNPLYSNLTVASTIGQRTRALRETILGWESLVELIKRLQLDTNIKSNYEFERLVSALRKEIQISLRNGNILELSYISNDPQKAKAVVQSVADIFVERNIDVQNKETSEAIRFIEEQLRVYRGKIKSAEIAQLKDKLKNLLIDSTEAHPLVKQLREQVNKKMDDLKKENLDYYEDSRLNAEATNPMLEQIKRSLDTLSEKSGPAPAQAAGSASLEQDLYYKAVLIDKLDNVMARDVGVNENIYNALLQRLETAKITQRLQYSKEGTKYIVLDPARVPFKPVSPNVALMIFMGLTLGIGAGVGLIFLAQFMDNSFLDVQDASKYFGAPLLGAISKINTVETIALAREKNTWMLFWMLSSGVLAVAFTVLVHAFIRP